MTTPFDALSDEQLVALAQRDPSGAEARQATEELFGRYGQRVYVWCLRVVRNHDRALDYAQDAMLSAVRALQQFQGHSRFSTWMFAIARNRCLRGIQRERLLVDDGAELESLPDPGPAPEIDLSDRQQEAQLLTLMDEVLEPEERRALWLRCVEGLPVEEITAMMGFTNASGARGVLQSARRKLRDGLARLRRREERPS